MVHGDMDDSDLNTKKSSWVNIIPHRIEQREFMGSPQQLTMNGGLNIKLSWEGLNIKLS